MSTRQRPGDLGGADARRMAETIGREIRQARRGLGLSLDEAGRRAGMSGTLFGRIERADLRNPSVAQLCRAARAVGLKPWFALYPAGALIHDAGQLAVLGRFERMLGAPLRLRREVAIPIERDPRAWDGRIDDATGTASIEAVARLEDIQELCRRIMAKQRDDPGAGVVILVLNRTNHNRRILAEHREALRAQFPQDGAAIARELRRGRVPKASGIILV